MYLVVHANIFAVSASVREGLVEMEGIQVEMKEELLA